MGWLDGCLWSAILHLIYDRTSSDQSVAGGLDRPACDAFVQDGPALAIQMLDTAVGLCSRASTRLHMCGATTIKGRVSEKVWSFYILTLSAPTT